MTICIFDEYGCKFQVINQILYSDILLLIKKFFFLMNLRYIYFLLKNICGLNKHFQYFYIVKEKGDGEPFPKQLVESLHPYEELPRRRNKES